MTPDHHQGPRSPASGYVALHASGELADRARAAAARLPACDLCPHYCGADRLAGERGRCRIGRHARVASACLHWGEERPLVGEQGSGTIFFSGCNLFCLFCQNADISHGRRGLDVGPADLAGLMLALQEQGGANINLVSPTHVVAQILEALVAAAAGGLHVPLVYNTGGYDSPETLRLLDGVVDIYMPDMKYGDSATAERLSGIPDYVARNQAAVREMHRQVGDLALDHRGLAYRGLLVRHLVLPEGLAGTASVMRLLAEEFGRDTYVNVMAQYHPCHEAWREPVLTRRLTPREYAEALDSVRAAGLRRQDL